MTHTTIHHNYINDNLMQQKRLNNTRVCRKKSNLKWEMHKEGTKWRSKGTLCSADAVETKGLIRTLFQWSLKNILNCFIQKLLLVMASSFVGLLLIKAQTKGNNQKSEKALTFCNLYSIQLVCTIYAHQILRKCVAAEIV